jgi:hypothetical protein
MSEPLTVQQAAAELGYTPDYVRDLLRQRVIKGRQFNRVWMIQAEEVERIKALQGPGGRLPKGVPEQLKGCEVPPLR